MDLKPFFLTETYFNVEDREMIRMLWEECLPEKCNSHVKRPEIFELLQSPKLTFKQVKDPIGAYMHVPGAWTEIVKCFKEHDVIYQYAYAHLFPKHSQVELVFQRKYSTKCALNVGKQEKERRN